MRIDDYTVLPLGTELDNGTIRTCTHCGKPGLAEDASGKLFFTHYQRFGWEDGKPVMQWMMCPPTVPNKLP
jgi:hypothetical protein